MSVEMKRLVDLDERDLALVPLGRNRVFRTLGVALFGLAVAMVAPKAVSADQPPPGPGGGCFGWEPCRYCAGDAYTYGGWQCTASGCAPPGYDLGCPGGGQCWNSCYSGSIYQCCDWYDPAGGCNPDKVAATNNPTTPTSASASAGTGTAALRPDLPPARSRRPPPPAGAPTGCERRGDRMRIESAGRGRPRLAMAGIFAGAATLGVASGIVAHGADGPRWVFALLILSAGIVGIAQQTLPEAPTRSTGSRVPP